MVLQELDTAMNCQTEELGVEVTMVIGMLDLLALIIGMTDFTKILLMVKPVILKWNIRIAMVMSLDQ